VVASRPLITTWKTDNAGVSDDNQITIGTNSDNYAYDYTIDWGDGQSDSNVTGDITHTYATSGIYTVTISGDFPQTYFTGKEDGVPTSDPYKLLSIEQWGDIKWLSANKAFYDANKLVDNSSANPMNYPDLRLVTSASEMFYNALKFNGDTRYWQVSAITDMSSMFFNASKFNQDLSIWDVSALTSTEYMFYRAINFNQDISAWDVSEVLNMKGMFYIAGSFNQDIGAWDVSSVTDMSYMFSSSRFNHDISAWDVSSVSDMSYMLYSSVLSTINYDALLLGWSILTLKENVNFSVGSLPYSATSQAARDILTSAPNNWVITDGGTL